MKKVAELCVLITQFVSEDPQPGIVVSELVDAEGRCHTFVDKVPIFTNQQLWVDSSYPQAGTMQCRLMGQLKDGKGRDLFRVQTIESTEGKNEFVVAASEFVELGES